MEVAGASQRLNLIVSAHIQSLPDEVLARIFIAGSQNPGWVPKRDHKDMTDHDHPRHPPRLKQFAKLVSQVCSRWRSIVRWGSNRRYLYYATVSLSHWEGADAGTPGIVDTLHEYLGDLRLSRDAELHIGWNFRIGPTSSFLCDRPIASADFVVPLFLHGMNLTIPCFNQVRSLAVDICEPMVLGFCFEFLNSLGQNSALTHLSITDSTFLTGRASKPMLTPTHAPFGSRVKWSGYCPLSTLNSLCELRMMYCDISEENLTIPVNLLHLTFFPSPHHTLCWVNLIRLLTQCKSLRSMTIELWNLSDAPELPEDAMICLPSLSKLVIVHADVEVLSVLLPSLSTPILEHLSLQSPTRWRGSPRGMHSGAKPTTSGLSDSESSEELSEKQPPCKSIFVAPSHLVIEELSICNIIPKLLRSMRLQNVETLRLAPIFKIDFEDSTARLNMPRLHTLQLACQSPMSWSSFLRCLELPCIHKLALTCNRLDGSCNNPDERKRKLFTESWFDISTQFREMASKLTSLELTIPYHGMANDILPRITNPFEDASQLRHLRLTGITKSNVDGIRLLEWGQPASCESNNDWAMSTMPSLVSLTIMIGRGVAARGDSETTETLASILTRLVAVQESRFVSGYAINEVRVITWDENLLWSSFDHIKPNTQLSETQF